MIMYDGGMSPVTPGAFDSQDPSATIAVYGGAAERLAEINAAAAHILTAVRPPNTKRAFATDWTHWEEFCATEGIPPTTVSAGLLVAFATWLAHPIPDGRPAQAPATIERRLAGVLDGWKQRELDIPHGVTAGARRVVRAYARDLVRNGESTGRGQAKALSIRNLRRVSEALPDTRVGLRDRSILTLGFAIAGRRSEIAALHVTDIEEHPSGLRVRIRDSKTGERTVAVRPGSSNLTCPVESWKAWIKAAGIDSGPAFRQMDRNDNVYPGGMSGAYVGALVTRAGAAVGLKLSGHSLRSGLATEARRAGHDAKTIAKQGGWKPNSAVLYGYMQIVDEWTDNATEGLGL